ncbi:SRPBCC family protein [Nocardioides marmoribigeumensis]|uniref:SRPBCC family protein n=1 Tax=Nocardioides marmoribigeumensis TaxID=433649 RepID=A0ABU2BWJ8_9ACTN|nr:SRPBCC family protein [Nocardioides marmoribigeumensis]MDR7362786.1 hypothetical protein [Nocardioides marmoribigeumensis]
MSLHVEASREVPGTPEEVYDAVIPTPLQAIFKRRHGIMPPIARTSEQEGVWGGTVGQTRRIHLADGGSLTETLVESDRPSRSSYTITDIAGPMRLLVSQVEGRWTFVPAGSRTVVTWAWTLHPTNAVTARLLPVVGMFWHGYARKALAEVERLVAA